MTDRRLTSIERSAVNSPRFRSPVVGRVAALRCSICPKCESPAKVRESDGEEQCTNSRCMWSTYEGFAR